VGAAHGERGESRENWRNGYRDRACHTRRGIVALRIPKLRRGSCFPAFLERPLEGDWPTRSPRRRRPTPRAGNGAW
jgi:transposase-like protein